MLRRTHLMLRLQMLDWLGLGYGRWHGLLRGIPLRLRLWMLDWLALVLWRHRHGLLRCTQLRLRLRLHLLPLLRSPCGRDVQPRLDEGGTGGRDAGRPGPILGSGLRERVGGIGGGTA